MTEVIFTLNETESTPRLVVLPGINEEQIDQLIKFTNVQMERAKLYGENERVKLDGDENRFATRQMFENWKQKGRTIYTICDENGDLCGIFWGGKKQLPKREDYKENFDTTLFHYTIAFRLAPSVRGMGISSEVFETCIRDFVDTQNVDGLWVELSAENEPSLRMALHAGFAVVSKKENSEGRIIMAKETKKS